MKIKINKQNALVFIGQLTKLIRTNNSIIFPETGLKTTGSKFGSLRKKTSKNPFSLTTEQVEVRMSEKNIKIINPLNAGFGYSNISIPFGTNILWKYNSFIWKDENGYWRQMKFSKQAGWTLKLTGGRTTLTNVKQMFYYSLPLFGNQYRFKGNVYSLAQLSAKFQIWAEQFGIDSEHSFNLWIAGDTKKERDYSYLDDYKTIREAALYEAKKLPNRDREVVDLSSIGQNDQLRFAVFEI